MSLVIALGSNIGDKEDNLKTAILKLITEFAEPIQLSHIYTSAPVGGIEQPDFYNMVIEFNTPKLDPIDILNKCLQIEEKMGRKRIIRWGPRIIDIDILFIDDLVYQSKSLEIPHPRIQERSFVMRPLSELPYYASRKNKFDVIDHFEIEAYKSTKINLARNN